MRIAVFIDGSNFYHMQRKLEWKIDVKKVLDYCSDWGEITDAYYYNGANDASEQQHSFFNMLASVGYTIVTKPIKRFTNSDGETVQKANLDIEIVLDMFTTIDTYDMAVLGSGDSDFARALQLLRARGTKFKVLFTAGSLAKENRYLCRMHFDDFQDIRERVEKTV